MFYCPINGTLQKKLEKKIKTCYSEITNYYRRLPQMDFVPAGFLINGFFIGSEVRQRNDGPGLFISVACGVNSYLVAMAQLYDVSKFKMGDPILLTLRVTVTKNGGLWFFDGNIV